MMPSESHRYPRMKIAIVFSPFKRSRDLLRKIEKCLDGNIPFRATHCSDGDSIKTDYFQIDAVPLSDKICGLRYDFVIIDDSISAEDTDYIIRPLISSRIQPAYIRINQEKSKPVARGFRRD